MSSIPSTLIETVTDHYLTAGLWADAYHADGELCECGWDLIDVTPDSRADAEESVGSFLELAMQYADTIAYVEANPEQAGHDLWLSANGHGAGFWDRGLGDLGERLHMMAQSIGGAELLVTSDGPEYTTR